MNETGKASGMQRTVGIEWGVGIFRTRSEPDVESVFKQPIRGRRIDDDRERSLRLAVGRRVSKAPNDVVYISDDLLPALYALLRIARD